ncbi:Chemotaxis protein CheA [Chromobacterium violaceum]|uniref:Chemotaxis protein CheA n=1 Tax=Chromobacterium violaceum TaxID=536 RepID=A0A447TI25_CHRVL|nr:Chemotaxis protein CheA [Chromobacterium violaceum]
MAEAVDGNAGLSKAQSMQFDLVLTDQNMPGMDGLTLIRSLRKQPSYNSTPILMLTTESSDQMKALGRAAGASAGWSNRSIRRSCWTSSSAWSVNAAIATGDDCGNRHVPISPGLFDETEEHLAAMESLLLAMDVAHPSRKISTPCSAPPFDQRGAATFGFSEMAELTHVLENLLDRVRKGAMGLTVEMVDAFLQAKDALQSMLGAYKNGEEPDGGRQEEIQRQLEAIESQAPEAETAASPQDEAPAAEQLWTLFLELTPLMSMTSAPCWKTWRRRAI